MTPLKCPNCHINLDLNAMINQYGKLNLEEKLNLLKKVQDCFGTENPIDFSKESIETQNIKIEPSESQTDSEIVNNLVLENLPNFMNLSTSRNVKESDVKKPRIQAKKDIEAQNGNSIEIQEFKIEPQNEAESDQNKELKEHSIQTKEIKVEIPEPRNEAENVPTLSKENGPKIINLTSSIKSSKRKCEVLFKTVVKKPTVQSAVALNNEEISKPRMEPMCDNVFAENLKEIFSPQNSEDNEKRKIILKIPNEKQGTVRFKRKCEVLFKKPTMNSAEMIYSCSNCDFTSESSNIFKQHTFSFMFCSKTCPKVFCGDRAEENLKIHKLKEHSLICQFCQQIFQSKTLLSKHQQIEHKMIFF